MTTILKRPSSPFNPNVPKRIKLEDDVQGGVDNTHNDDDEDPQASDKITINRLNKLLHRPTGKDKLVALASLPDPLPTFEPICPQTTTTSCPLFQKDPKSCPYPHYEPIIRPWTDSRLGQCSYLNMCYGESSFASNPSLLPGPNAPGSGSGGTKQCRYQHYRLLPPRPAQPNAHDANEMDDKNDMHTVSERVGGDGQNEPLGGRGKRLPRMSDTLKRGLLRGPKGLQECQGEGYGLAEEMKKGQLEAVEDSGLESIAAGNGGKQWLNMDVRNLDADVLGRFDLILADPPWDIHMNLPYHLLTDDDLRQLPIPSLQPDWGILALWVTGRAMELARELFGIWGYRRFDEIVWVKTGQLGGLVRTGRTGHWLNHTCEHLLLGIKLPPASIFPDRSAPIPWTTDPALARFKRGMDGDVVVSEVRETSRKPDEVYGLLERCASCDDGVGKGSVLIFCEDLFEVCRIVPSGRKLEIFGRKHNTRPGWLTVGNQLGDSMILDPELERRVEKAGILLDEATALANASAKTATATANKVG